MADWKSALAALGATEEPNDNKELMEQREQSQARLNSAESRQKKTEGQKTDIDRKKRVGVVYSTNPDYEYSDDSQEETDALPKNQQKLRLNMQRAGRGGKTVTHLMITDKERWWNILFDIDLVLWLAKMFLELPHPRDIIYEIFPTDSLPSG